MEVEVEPAQEFHEPLVDERLRNNDEDPPGPSSQVETVEDQGRLDRFAKADFIGEENARGVAPRDLAGDIKLVRQEIDRPPQESPHGRTQEAVVIVEGVHAQVVRPLPVDLRREQPLIPAC